MLEDEVSDVIATALWNQDITYLSANELDELAMFQYVDDADVEFVEIDFTEEAGAEGHGVNTEEEMLHTLGDE